MVIDVLESRKTGNVSLYIRFVHNLGNVRPYDILELSAERTLGLERWTLANLEDLEAAIAKRRERLDDEVENLLDIVRERV